MATTKSKPRKLIPRSKSKSRPRLRFKKNRPQYAKAISNVYINIDKEIKSQIKSLKDMTSKSKSKSKSFRPDNKTMIRLSLAQDKKRKAIIDTIKLAPSTLDLGSSSVGPSPPPIPTTKKPTPAAVYNRPPRPPAPVSIPHQPPGLISPIQKKKIETLISNYQGAETKREAERIVELWIEYKVAKSPNLINIYDLEKLIKRLAILDYFYGADPTGDDAADILAVFKGIEGLSRENLVTAMEEINVVIERQDADEIADAEAHIIGSGRKKGGFLLPELRDERPKSIREMLSSVGDWSIVGLRICRKPIPKMIERLANIITVGYFEKNKKIKVSPNVDEYFHVFSKIELRDPDSGEHLCVLLEKNERVQVLYCDDSTASADTQELIIPVTHLRSTLREYIENGERYAQEHGYSMYIYDAVSANCQLFQEWILKGNGLWRASYSKFVLQDVEKAVTPWLRYLLRGVTDLKARLDIVFRGRGR